MSALITLSEVEKSHGAQSLLSGVSFSVGERERIGVIGPNGAGKSTLMRILVGQSEVDSGAVWRRKGLRVSYAAQSAIFPPDRTAFELALDAARSSETFSGEAERIARGALARAGLEMFEARSDQLSGGQRKRLQLALALCESPDILILDEPTNHLDIEAILELEELLQRATFSWMVVSHDRWFLETSAQRIIEVNKVYPTGLFDCEGSYGEYLRRREAFLAAERERLASLANTVRYEQAWLRQGVKARGTKAKHRIDKALDLMESLSLVRARTRDVFSEDRESAISFTATERKTKRLVELVGVRKSFGERLIISKLTLTLVGGEALGLLGRNGSGKSTLLQLIAGNLTPDAGTIKTAHGLSIAHFHQFDDAMDESAPLKRVLSEGSDTVVFAGAALHVASWAQRFRFSYEQLNQPYGSLSGGERSRARIAKLMLTTADLLLLDEPTNDLDIDTLEMLEQALLEFPGAVVLVTHDRFMINRLCSRFLGMDGSGGTEFYADYEQWFRELRKRERAVDGSAKGEKGSPSQNEEPVGSSSVTDGHSPKIAPGKQVKKKLSYMEQRELDGIEESIGRAEERVSELTTAITAPENQADGQRLRELCDELAEAHQRVDTLYARWQELEDKRS